MDKRIKKLKRQLEQQGWRIEAAKSGAFMAYPPDRALGPVLIHLTPSDHHAYANTLARLKQRGFQP